MSQVTPIPTPANDNIKPEPACVDEHDEIVAAVQAVMAAPKRKVAKQAPWKRRLEARRAARRAARKVARRTIRETVPAVVAPAQCITIPKSANDNAKVLCGDCRDLFAAIPDQSIEIVITDPPYFLQGMGEDWDNAELQRRSRNPAKIGSLPPNTRFDPKQGRDFQAFMSEVSEQVFRVLKPGGFYISFSQARLYHRMAVAVEDVGFEVREMLGWVRPGLPRAMKLDHFIDGRDDADAIRASIGGRKTPMINQTLEPMVLAQKPRDGTFVDNWMRHGVGLVDTSQTLDGGFPKTLMSVDKPTKAAKDADGNDHLTVKPVALIEHLLRLFSKPGDTLLDPFAGSGSHGVAAINTGRGYIGFERDPHNVEIIEGRLRRAA